MTISDVVILIVGPVVALTLVALVYLEHEMRGIRKDVDQLRKDVDSPSALPRSPRFPRTLDE